ncbi:hypothetical protein DDE05_23405, partial [Streptomyces cavourensis]
ASLSNTNGKVVSGGALDVNTTGNLDNTGGTVAAQGQATLNAQTLSNTRGLIAAGNLTLNTQGLLDNRAGLIQADNLVALKAGSLNNRDTLANGLAGVGAAMSANVESWAQAGTPTLSGTPAAAAAMPTSTSALGVMGKQVTVNASAIDNQSGRIGAGQDLGVATGTLDNTSGNVSSDANAKLAANNLINSSGAVTAGSSLELTTDNLDNDGKLHAGQDLKITANTLTNRATGELIALRNNTLVIGGLLANAGLI